MWRMWQYDNRTICDKSFRYKIHILSQALSPITSYFARKLAIENYMCPVLVEKKGVFTGNVKIPTFKKSACKYHSRYGCKAQELLQSAKKSRIDIKHVVAVGGSAGDARMLATARIGIAFGNSKSLKKVASLNIENLSELLLYI